MRDMKPSSTTKQRGFGHGGLRLVILKLMDEQPRHGYEVIKAIEELTAGHYRPSAGMVYPLLTQLFEQGLIQVHIEPEKDDKKNKYMITARGQQLLQEEAIQVDQIFYRIAQRAKQPEQVINAIHRFKSAVRNKLTDETLSPEQANRFAEILENAVQHINVL